MLSEEEKKAIKILKTNPKTILDLIVLDEKLLDKLSEFENYSVEEVKDWACETVLNLITKLQKENKEKDRYIKNKDKQIDLMAELVYKRFKAELLLEYGFENEEQLKQYFAGLVEKE